MLTCERAAATGATTGGTAGPPRSPGVEAVAGLGPLGRGISARLVAAAIFFLFSFIDSSIATFSIACPSLALALLRAFCLLFRVILLNLNGFKLAINLVIFFLIFSTSFVYNLFKTSGKSVLILSSSSGSISSTPLLLKASTTKETSNILS